MIFYVTGGIANVGTGMARRNICRCRYFGVKNLLLDKRVWFFFLTSCADTYAEKGSNRTSSLLKYFDYCRL